MITFEDIQLNRIFMSTKEEASNANEKGNDVMDVKVNVENSGEISNIMNNLDTAFDKDEVIINMAAEYLMLEKDSSIKLVFIQMLQQEDVNEETGVITPVDVALFVNEDKKTFVTKSVVIRNAVKNLPKGSTVLITAQGEKKLDGKRKLNLFDVQLLG